MVIAMSVVLFAIGIGLMAIAIFAQGPAKREAAAVRAEPPLEAHAPPETRYVVHDTIDLAPETAPETQPEPIAGPVIGPPPAHEPEPVVAQAEPEPLAPVEPPYPLTGTPEERFVAIEALARRAAFDDVAHALDDVELPIALQAAYLLRENGHREIVDGYLARAEPARASELSGLLELIAP